MRGLVIGLGHDDRADDAAGPMVARLVSPHLPEGWRAVEHHGDLIALVDLCAGIDEVVIVDAVATGAAAGTVHHFVVDEDDVPNLSAAGSTHGFGLLDAIALGRALGRVRGRISLVGIEARQVAVGAPMTFEVQVALPLVAARVLEDVLSGTV